MHAKTKSTKTQGGKDSKKDSKDATTASTIESLIHSTREKDSTLLTKYKSTLLKTNPAAKYIGQRLTTSESSLRESPSKSVPIKQREQYPRTEKNLFSKGEHIPGLYEKQDLANGDCAHVGNYCNLLQAAGDKFKPSKTKLKTTTGDGELYHKLLEYRLKICKYIADGVAKHKPKFIKCGVYHNYPCVMVLLKENSVFKSSKSKDLSAAAFEDWVNFNISFFLGMVNHKAVEKNIHIELERRASFGFLSPTIAPTGNSMRISAGIVPKIYADLLIECLKNLDKLFSEFEDDIEDIDALPDQVFYGSKAHKKYLGKKYKTPELDNIVQLLFAQVEKAGKTTVQNVMRTPFAREGIAMEVFKTLNSKKGKSLRDAFIAGIEWAIDKMSISDTKTPRLIFEQTEDLEYVKIFKQEKSSCNDSDFWEVIETIANAAKKLKDSKLDNAIERLTDRKKHKLLNQLYYSLEFLNEMIFIVSLKPAKKKDYGDGYGSDSDTEEEVDGTLLYHKKITTHNGMRAIWDAVIESEKFLQDSKIYQEESYKKSRIYLQGSYYEILLGLKVICDLHKITITKTKEMAEANIILQDVNPCITDGKPLKEFKLAKAGKIIILDVTSATTKDVFPYIKQFVKSRAAKALFLVSSGFKHQQMGADKNQFGTIRIFTKEKDLTDKYYEDIKKFEPKLLAKSAQDHRHNSKAMGAVPTAKQYLKARL